MSLHTAGHRRGVVAGRKRDDAAPPDVGGQLRHRVVRAAELERAGALEVLALEEHGGAGTGVDRTGRDHWRPMRDAVQAGRCGSNVREGGKRDDSLIVQWSTVHDGRIPDI